MLGVIVSGFVVHAFGPNMVYGIGLEALRGLLVPTTTFVFRRRTRA